MPKKFEIWGNPGYADEQLLEDFDSSREAIDWATRYCRRDLGGYDSIEVLSFSGLNGEVTTHWRKTADVDA